MIAKRLLVHVGGYDPMTPQAAYRRFAREFGRFRTTWAVSTDVTEPTVTEDLAVWSAEADGGNWAVRTEVWFLRWDDVMAQASRDPMWRRLPAGLLAFADFIGGGAFFGYCRWAWPYALFFLYPLVLLSTLAAISAYVGYGVALLVHSALAGALAGALALVAILHWGRHRLRLDHLLDDWSFARRTVRRPDAILEPRVARVADALVAVVQDGTVDEVVVLGHSLGAVVAVDLLDRALVRDPALATGRVKLAFVTVGSSILKMGFHRRATRLREALARVAAAPGLFWVEYQARIDAMNFYNVDPVRALALSAPSPVIRKVNIRRMLNQDYYKTIRRNFLRLHNQFVSGNDQREIYDYFMLACGPLPVEEQATDPDSAVAAIAADGRLMGDAVPSPVPSGP